jgi:hypothetical protein
MCHRFRSRLAEEPRRSVSRVPSGTAETFADRDRREECRGQVVTPASPDSTAVVEGTIASDVLLLLKTGLRYIPTWKSEG